MTLTKQHFAMIADQLLKAREETLTLDEMAESFADKLEATNDRFDRARFLRACGVND